MTASRVFEHERFQTPESVYYCTRSSVLIPELILVTDSNSNSHSSLSLHSHQRNMLKTYQEGLQTFLFL